MVVDGGCSGRCKCRYRGRGRGNVRTVIEY